MPHIPLEYLSVERSIDHQRGQWSCQTDATQEGVVQTVISRHPAHGTQMAGCTGISTRLGRVEAALVKEHQLFWMLEEGSEVIEKLRSQFLKLFFGDQCFFYG